MKSSREFQENSVGDGNLFAKGAGVLVGECPPPDDPDRLRQVSNKRTTGRTGEQDRFLIEFFHDQKGKYPKHPIWDPWHASPTDEGEWETTYGVTNSVGSPVTIGPAETMRVLGAGTNTIVSLSGARNISTNETFTGNDMENVTESGTEIRKKKRRFGVVLITFITIAGMVLADLLPYKKACSSCQMSLTCNGAPLQPEPEDYTDIVVTYEKPEPDKKPDEPVEEDTPQRKPQV